MMCRISAIPIVEGIQVVLVLCEIWVPTGFAQTEIAQKKHIFPIRNNG